MNANKIVLLIASALLVTSCKGGGNSVITTDSSIDEQGAFVSASAAYKGPEPMLYGDKVNKEHFDFKIQYEKKTIMVSPNDFDISITSKDTFTTDAINATLSLKSDPSITASITLTPSVRGSLKLLFIGNSFSDDTIQWMYESGRALGLDMLVENMYIGGCSLDTHYNNILYNNANYQWVHRVDNGWVRTPSYTLSDAIMSQDWDFISFQQSSGVSGQTGSYVNLLGLMEETKNYLQDPTHTQFVWNMTWAYQGDSNHSDFPKYNSNQMTMYNAICDAVQTAVMPLEDMAAVIPNGTAIQNARTSYVGDHLTRDGYHLTMDLGRYIAGLNAIKTLTGIDIDPCRYSPVDSTQTLIAKESVDNSQIHKFEVTTSQYQENPMSLSAIKRTHHMRSNTIQRGYYNAKTGNPTNIAYNASNSFDNQFACTEIIPTEEFIDGTIIYIKSGYKYRPEAWRSLTENIDARPPLTSVELVEVNAEWRSDYSYRAFNISRTDSAQLTDQEIEDIKSGEIFAIFLPGQA